MQETKKMTIRQLETKEEIKKLINRNIALNLKIENLILCEMSNLYRDFFYIAYSGDIIQKAKDSIITAVAISKPSEKIEVVIFDRNTFKNISKKEIFTATAIDNFIVGKGSKIEQYKQITKKEKKKGNKKNE